MLTNVFRSSLLASALDEAHRLSSLQNVYEIYARHSFASLVIPLFLEAYKRVDHNTRSKVDKTLLAWRTGGVNGQELALSRTSLSSEVYEVVNQGKQIYVLVAEHLHASDTYNLGYALHMDPYDNSKRGL